MVTLVAGGVHALTCDGWGRRAAAAADVMWQVVAVAGMAAAVSVIPHQAFVTTDGWSSFENAAFVR